MARVHIRDGENVADVAEALRRIGIVMRQRLPDGSYMCHVFDPEALNNYLLNLNPSTPDGGEACPA